MYLWQAFHFHVIYASSIYTTYNREIMKPYVYYITIHSLSNENLIEHFLIHRLHTKTSTITKPKPERKNSKEPTRAPRASNSGIPRSQTQTLTRMDKVVIGDYYLMANNGWNHKLDETSTFVVNFFSKPYNPLLYNCLYFKNSKYLFKCKHKRRSNISLNYTMYTNISDNTPFYTHDNLCLV